MSATIIDSRIFGNIFSTDAMRRVWSDENRTAKYVEIEKALAIVQGRLGIIPQEAADEIVRNCDIDKIDMDKLRAQTERIGYPILGVVSQIERAVPRQARRILSLGCDDAGHHRHRDGDADPRRAGDLSTTTWRRSPHALAGSGAALSRYADGRAQQSAAGDPGDVRLQDGDDPRRRSSAIASASQQLRPRVLVGEFGGACGTLASIEKGAMETQAGLMAELGLAQAGHRLAHGARHASPKSAASSAWSAARSARSRWT